MLALGLTACVTVASAAEVRVELHRKAIVPAADIVVEDVATVESDEIWLKQRIERLRIGSAPRAGEAGYIWQSQVERQIALTYPEILKQIRWSGASRVDVRLAGNQLDGVRVQSAAREYLEDSLRRDYSKVNVEVAAKIEPLTVPRGAIALTPRRCGRENPARRMCVWVDVSVDGVPFRSVPIWFKVEAYRTVFVAKRSMAAGAGVDTESITDENRDIAAVSGTPLVPGDDLRALRLRHAVTPGRILLRGDLEPFPAVARNQKVTVEVRVGSVVVEAPGLALADGQRGAVIRIQNPGSKKAYSAEIIDDGVVAVHIR
jgi:flagella basal body P-ring formation protein FlgA